MDEVRTIGPYVVKKYLIHGSNPPYYVYAVYERMTDQHSSILTIDGLWYGKVTTRFDPSLFDGLPAMSDERLTATRHYFNSLRELSYSLILAAFPELVSEVYETRDGEIVQN